MLGSITVTEREELKVHAYSAPEDGWAVNTHDIELADQLVVIDAQYTLVFANRVVAYAATLNRPISQLYVTHYHPDHLLGVAVFSTPIFGLSEVAKIEQLGDPRWLVPIPAMALRICSRRRWQASSIRTLRDSSGAVLRHRFP